MMNLGNINHQLAWRIHILVTSCSLLIDTSMVTCSYEVVKLSLNAKSHILCLVQKLFNKCYFIIPLVDSKSSLYDLEAEWVIQLVY